MADSMLSLQESASTDRSGQIISNSSRGLLLAKLQQLKNQNLTAVRAQELTRAFTHYYMYFKRLVLKYYEIDYEQLATFTRQEIHEMVGLVCEQTRREARNWRIVWWSLGPISFGLCSLVCWLNDNNKNIPTSWGFQLLHKRLVDAYGTDQTFELLCNKIKS